MSDVKAIYIPDASVKSENPLFMIPVSAGFPSPADDYIEGKLDLNTHLVKNPAATFFVRVAGESMIGAGIYPDDILIVDRSLHPVDKKVVIAIIDGELTVKRMRIKDGDIYLVPENDLYTPVKIKKEMDFEVWGVVTSVIHSL